MVAQAVADHMNKQLAPKEAVGSEANQALKYLVSLIEARQATKLEKKVTISATKAPAVTAKEPNHAAPVTLQSILKAAKRSGH